MLELAFKVKQVYFDIFEDEIPIFINKNKKLTEYYSNKKNSKVNSISNSLIQKYSVNIDKNLDDGIHDLFKYLQNNL